MFCTSCGGQNDESASHCIYCGTPLEGGAVNAVAQGSFNQQQGYAQAQSMGGYQQGNAQNMSNQQYGYQQQPNGYGQPNNGFAGQSGGYYYNGFLYPDVDPNWKSVNKYIAAILAICFGGLGIHKFYMGKTGSAIIRIIFCWTFIPGIVGLVEGILYLVTDDHDFMVKNKVKLG